MGTGHNIACHRRRQVLEEHDGHRLMCWADDNHDGHPFLGFECLDIEDVDYPDGLRKQT